MSNINKRAIEYRNQIRSITDDQLKEMKGNLISRIKSEQAKPSPDIQLVNNYKWQGRQLNWEWKRRHAKEDRFSQMEARTEESVKTYADLLREKTLGELKKMLAEANSALTELDKPTIGRPNISEINRQKAEWLDKRSKINAEISTRDKKASDDAKNDIDKALNKLMGIDRNYINAGLAGLVGGGIVGWALGKNVLGWALIGSAFGAGVVYLAKNVKPA